MSLVLNKSSITDAITGELHQENTSSNGVQTEVEELSIQMKSTIHHPNAMSEMQKSAAQKDAPSMAQLFESTMRSKGEFNPSKMNWVDDNVVEVEGLSQMALHSFLLEAEALGKEVTYTKQTTIRISN